MQQPRAVYAFAPHQKYIENNIMFLNYIMYNTTYYYMYYYYVNNSIHYILQIMDAILFFKFDLKPTQQTFGNPTDIW